MKQGFFITGTDTGVGKTWATVALMEYFKQHNKSVIGMKPIASGCKRIKGVLKNDDALLLQDHASLKLKYQQINTYSFLEPVSPHLAADVCINIDKIVQNSTKLSTQADVLLVEGVGGWLVPLNDQGDTVETLAQALEWPVILVVGMRLGCLNHACLTDRAIQRSGVKYAGWLAMCLEPKMRRIHQNITTLEKTMTSPLLGIIPYSKVPNFKLFSENIIFNVESLKKS
jgi:dethiobiotin synthetase